MLKEQEYSLELSGKGETKESAFNNIFAQIKPYIAKKFPDAIVIKIEPQEVVVVSAQENAYTEKFLGLLFPRKRTSYDISVMVTVQLKLIGLAQISFK